MEFSIFFVILFNCFNSSQFSECILGLAFEIGFWGQGVHHASTQQKKLTMRTKHLLQTFLVALFSILMITDYATASTFGGRTYKVGDYIEINGVGGVVFAVSNNGQNGKAVSLKEFECDWDSAAQKCSSLGKGWQLPSISEWRAIDKQKSVINNTLASMAEKGLSIAFYWSSVEDNSDCAWLFLVGYGSTRYNSKRNAYYVRAFSAF
ncbi:MAG: DUF1566 domain-containing protein [Alistipes sp.]|nr:DUF1566 domain-containing protein [Alistipes sp.]